MLEFTQAASQTQPKYLTVAAPLQLSPRSMPRIRVGSTCLSSDSTTEQGQKLRARTDIKKQEELAPKSVLEWSHGYLHQRRPGPLSVADMNPSSGGSSVFPHSRARILVWVEGSTHTQREQSQLRLTLRASAPCLLGGWQQLSGGEVLPHTQCLL